MKRRVEKIPGFEEHQTASSTAETDSTMSRESVPLKEKLIDPTTMQEVEKQAENTGKSVTRFFLVFGYLWTTLMS